MEFPQTFIAKEPRVRNISDIHHLLYAIFESRALQLVEFIIRARLSSSPKDCQERQKPKEALICILSHLWTEQPMEDF